MARINAVLVSAFLILTSIIQCLAQNNTNGTRSNIRFKLLHCDHFLAGSPYNLPDPHPANRTAWNLIELYSPADNSTQHVSTSPGYPYTPYRGSNLTAIFWSTGLGRPRGILSTQLPDLGRLKVGVYAGKVVFEEQDFECITEFGSGYTAGGADLVGKCGGNEGWCASYMYCAARYTCKQWETPPPRDADVVCPPQHGVDNCYPLWSN